MPYAPGIDGFIAKYTPQNGFQWAISLAGVVGAVALDSQNNILVTGYFEGSVNIGGVSLNAYGGAFDYDIFVAKFSPTGNPIWVKQFGGTATDIGTAIAVDGSDNVIFGARFGSSGANFGGVTLTTLGGFDIAIAKLSGSTGNTLWATSGGSSNNDFLNGLTTDSSGNVLVTGQAGGPINLSGALTGSGGYFVAKYAGASGGNLWAVVESGVAGNGIAADQATGNVFVTGQGNGGLFLNAYGTSGNLLWTKSFGGSGDAGQAVCVDGSGDLAITGYSGSLLDFGGSYLIGGSYYVASFTTSGAYQWALRPSPNGGGGTGIAYDTLGHLLTTGNFYSTANFGGTSVTASTGATDGFLSQYDK